jgi:hypothetical protein
MSPAKGIDIDCIQFLIAAHRVYTCTEAPHCTPNRVEPPALDAFVRLLHRQPPDMVALWQEVAPYVRHCCGVVVLDGTTLDKPYARNIDVVTRHSGANHHAVVAGIKLLMLRWIDGAAWLPCDCRIYDKPLPNGHTKNEHFRAMLVTANHCGFPPSLVCFDSWYSSMDNVKAVREQGWFFLSRLKQSWLVNPDEQGNVPISTVVIRIAERRVHLKGFGSVQVFRSGAPNGDADYWVPIHWTDLGVNKPPSRRNHGRLRNIIVA